MKEMIPSPCRGNTLKATWGASVANAINSFATMSSPGMLSRDGFTGSGAQQFPSNRRDRAAAPEVHPWKVYALAKSEYVDHCFEIYIPSGSLHVGEDSIEVEGVTPVEGSSDRYTIDCEDEITSQSTLTLAVYRDDDAAETEGVASAEDETPYWSAKIISDIEEIEDAEEVLAILPIATVSIDSSGDDDVGNVESQLVRSAVAFTFVQPNTDKVSIDAVTDESAEDPSALQVKDFDNDESDGSQGLAQRLKVVKNGEDSYEIESESNDSSIHLVARVNGKIKYIPLSGSKDKDPDEEDPGTGKDPCAHDESGSSGGVSPEDEGNESGGRVGTEGGVPAADGDQYHTGDDNCNCP